MLSNGDPFPHLSLAGVDGQTITLPSDLRGSFGVVLLYRGAWCPYCNAQLAGFARAAGELTTLGVKVVALSVDDQPTSRALVEKHSLPFPVGFGADLGAVSRATGAYTNAEPPYLQTTGFILDADGRVLMAVYSSGALGRLVAADVVGFIRYLKSHG